MKLATSVKLGIYTLFHVQEGERVAQHGFEMRRKSSKGVIATLEAMDED